ncbi:endonuclease/exonuclease/phosphatase family protein [Flagellimonas sp. S174]|uniref:endonuclease/exonuclease/phosphatase family protein n=1 Tax=Flagellimonas sp. S174 TaxID=3410790 RepID=UPI003BF5E6F3
MKIAAFNVENLFDRAKAFNQPESESQEILTKTAELNSIIDQDSYAGKKDRLIELLKELGLSKSDKGPFVILRQIRERLVKRRKNKPMEIIANGREDWVGWAELKLAPVNERAIKHTGMVIRDVDADILAVVEAEDRVSLKLFSDIILEQVDGQPYDKVMVIDGNDERGIDVGLMTKKEYQISLMKSHIHDLNSSGRTIFSRDCPEYQVITPSGESVWVIPNHFKSKYGGDSPRSQARREGQAKRAAEIYNELKAKGETSIVVLGDLNDTPDSDPLKPLLEETDLKDVSEHPTFDTGEFKGKPGTNDKGTGTYGLGNDNNKIDYLLLSPDLFARVTASGLFRKGAWPGSRPKRWTVYPTLTRKVHVASDHHVIWAVID